MFTSYMFYCPNCGLEVLSDSSPLVCARCLTQFTPQESASKEDVFDLGTIDLMTGDSFISLCISLYHQRYGARDILKEAARVRKWRRNSEQSV